MTYYESAQNTQITLKRAFKEVKSKHRDNQPVHDGQLHGREREELGLTDDRKANEGSADHDLVDELIDHASEFGGGVEAPRNVTIHRVGQPFRSRSAASTESGPRRSPEPTRRWRRCRRSPVHR